MIERITGIVFIFSSVICLYAVSSAVKHSNKNHFRGNWVTTEATASNVKTTLNPGGEGWSVRGHSITTMTLTYIHNGKTYRKLRSYRNTIDNLTPNPPDIRNGHVFRLMINPNAPDEYIFINSPFRY